MKGTDDLADVLFFDHEKVEVLDVKDAPILLSGHVERWKSGWICLRPSQFSIVNIEQGYEFKRRKDCSFLVSRNHFSIEFIDEGRVLIDHSSNGTFLNRKRIPKEKAQKLSDFDRIFAGGMEFIVFEDVLLCPWKETSSVSRLGKRKPRKNGTYRLPEISSSSPLRLENPPSLVEEQSGSSPSPAGMIAISSLASVLSSWLVSGMEMRSALGSLAGAGMSAAAFAGWYRYSGLKQKKGRREQNEKLKTRYLAYLEQELEKKQAESETHRLAVIESQKRMQSFSAETLGCFRDSNAGFPAGIQSEMVSDFERPSISWQQQESVCARALEQIGDHTSLRWSWTFFKPGETLKLSYKSFEQIEQLIRLWCWMVRSDRKRLALLDIELPDSLHECRALQLEGKHLAFCKERELLEQINAYPKIEFTLLTTRHLTTQPENLTVLELVSSDPKLPMLWMSEERYPSMTLRESDYPQAESVKKRALKTLMMEKLESRKEEKANLCVELDEGVFWDLEKEGPHALVAGATGSGKSEGLSLVLYQLALQNDPKLCSWVLIDFKGGAFAKPFKQLPHTAGLVSNLDERAIDRLEKALEIELNTRQKQAADPKAEGVRSHLLICVDEFGQLKARYPEFMKKLQETARIGRSLGVHLILSTQKPAGLVDEQIWANSRSRICFPVLDRADSMEVLGHEGAWKLKEPGEFILQSSEGEKSGRAFYLKDPWKGSRIQWKHKQQLWQNLPYETLESRIAGLLEKSGARRWVLAPDPAVHSEEFEGIVQDDYCAIHPWIPVCGNPVLALVDSAHQEDFLKALMNRRTRPAVSNFDCPKAIRMDELNLWRMVESCKNRPPETYENAPLVILNLQNELPSELLEALLAFQSVCIVLLSAQISFKQQSLVTRCPVRLCSGIESREQLSLCFDGKLNTTSTWPVLQTIDHGKQLRLICSTQNKESTPSAKKGSTRFIPEKREALLEELAGREWPLLLGQEEKSLQPVDWQRALVLIFDDEAGWSRAKGLVRRLSLLQPSFSIAQQDGEADLMLINALSNPPTGSKVQSWMEQKDVLFFGGAQKRWPEIFGSGLYESLQAKAWLVRKGKGFPIQTAMMLDHLLEKERGE